MNNESRDPKLAELAGWEDKCNDLRAENATLNGELEKARKDPGTLRVFLAERDEWSAARAELQADLQQARTDVANTTMLQSAKHNSLMMARAELATLKGELEKARQQKQNVQDNSVTRITELEAELATATAGWEAVSDRRTDDAEVVRRVNIQASRDVDTARAELAEAKNRVTCLYCGWQPEPDRFQPEQYAEAMTHHVTNYCDKHPFYEEHQLCSSFEAECGRLNTELAKANAKVGVLRSGLLKHSEARLQIAAELADLRAKLPGLCGAIWYEAITCPDKVWMGSHAYAELQALLGQDAEKEKG